MARPKKTAPAPAMGTPKKSNSPDEENPVTPPRPRILCPGCKNELTIHETVANSQAFIYASKLDMKKLGLECQHAACPLYLEGIEGVDERREADPNIEKYVEMAKKSRAAIKAEERQRQREEAEAEYTYYDPFSGEAEEEAAEAADAADAAKRYREEQVKIDKAWESIQVAAAALEQMEKEAKPEEKKGCPQQ